MPGQTARVVSSQSSVIRPSRRVRCSARHPHQTRERQRPDRNAGAKRTQRYASCQFSVFSYQMSHQDAARRPRSAACHPAPRTTRKRNEATGTLAHKPRPPESLRSWPPPSCLRASVPSCLFRTNRTHRTPEICVNLRNLRTSLRNEPKTKPEATSPAHPDRPATGHPLRAFVPTCLRASSLPIEPTEPPKSASIREIRGPDYETNPRPSRKPQAPPTRIALLLATPFVPTCLFLTNRTHRTAEFCVNPRILRPDHETNPKPTPKPQAPPTRIALLLATPFVPTCLRAFVPLFYQSNPPNPRILRQSANPATGSRNEPKTNPEATSPAHPDRPATGHPLRAFVPPCLRASVPTSPPTPPPQRTDPPPSHAGRSRTPSTPSACRPPA